MTLRSLLADFRRRMGERHQRALRAAWAPRLTAYEAFQAAEVIRPRKPGRVVYLNLLQYRSEKRRTG